MKIPPAGADGLFVPYEDYEYRNFIDPHRLDNVGSTEDGVQSGPDRSKLRVIAKFDSTGVAPYSRSLTRVLTARLGPSLIISPLLTDEWITGFSR